MRVETLVGNRDTKMKNTAEGVLSSFDCPVQYNAEIDACRLYDFEPALRTQVARKPIADAMPVLPVLELVFDKAPPREAEPPEKPFITKVAEFNKAFDELYPRLQKDKQGGISLASIDRALEDPRFSGSDAQVLAVLKTHFKDICALGPYWGRHLLRSRTITPQAISTLKTAVSNIANGRKVEGHLSDLVDNMRTIVVLSPQSIKEQSKQLYAKQDDPLRSIVPEAVNQPFTVGDCYFEAALASLAKVRPADIQKMIKDNGNGTFTVTFPGAKTEPITVNRPSQAEVAFYGGQSSHGMWPWILRKAYGKYCNTHFWRRDITNLVGPRTDVEGLDGGSSRDHGIRMLTGKDVSKIYAKSTSFDDMNRQLDQMLNKAADTRLLTASTRSAGPKHTKDNFTAGHDYSVIGYKPNAANPKEGMITLRDPVPGDGGGTGTRTISLKAFKENFYTIDLEKR